ncbi:MAG: germination protein YpeB [Clostridia bacterium]|nr:germination protein YpeB [Clostridia bacterium]
MSKKEISSGTEKAESLTRKKSGVKSEKTENAKKTAEKKSVNKTVKNNEKSAPVKQTKKDKGAKAVQTEKKKVKKNKPAKKLSEKQIKRKEAREKKKIEIAKIRAEKKQKRLEKKLEAKQKRLEKLAAIKQAREERKEKRRERRDMLKHESKEARRERVLEERQAKIEAKKAKADARVAKREAAMADKRAKREHRLKMQAQKRAEKNEKRHAPGFGGWLAAVISLGVTTLALGTMLTFGWINMNGMQDDMATVHTESIYELNSIVDNLDTNLSKARVSNSRNEQVRLLTDIAIESEMAETVIERLPLNGQLTENMTSFVNKMGDGAQSMLYSVASGNTLTESQIATIEYMYKVNKEMKAIINELTANANNKDMLAAMSGKSGNLLSSSFDTIQNTTVETPKEINDGPFAENIDKVTAKNLEGLEEISATRAEELAREYFESYNVSDVRCTGEMIAEQLACYNITLTTNDGEMSAQLSKLGGKVVEFNSFKDCSLKNFSVERCIDIAEDFLDDLGYDDMKAVWTSENGTTCNLNFAYEKDGVIFYSDMIKVKVCEERGIVTGMEGLSYVLNHVERTAPSAKITKSDAQAKLHSGLEVETARLCVVPIEGNEVLAYEFYGSFDGSDYYVYIDAKTGEEVQVFTVIGTAQGRALM